MPKKAATVAAEPKKITGTMSDAIRQALTKLGADASSKDVGEWLQSQFPDDTDLEAKIAVDATWSATVSGQRNKVREALGLAPSATGARKGAATSPISKSTSLSDLQHLVEGGLDLKAVQDAIKEVDRFNRKSGKRAVSLAEIVATVEMAQSQFEEMKKQTQTLEKFFG